jgi:hypothetical protein
MPGYYIGRGNNPPANKTEYANSLLVDGIGQILEGPRSGDAAAVPLFFDRVSSISHRGSTGHYSFSRSVGGRLYDPKLGLKTFDRSILFVDRADSPCARCGAREARLTAMRSLITP